MRCTPFRFAGARLCHTTLSPPPFTGLGPTIELNRRLTNKEPQNGEVKRIPFKSSFLRHSAVPCSIFCGSLPECARFPVNACLSPYPDPARARAHAHARDSCWYRARNSCDPRAWRELCCGRMPQPLFSRYLTRVYTPFMVTNSLPSGVVSYISITHSFSFTTRSTVRPFL